jgi:hypothetical protein
MLQLLLIDVALCALLVVVAGCIMLVRRRRRRAQAPADAGERPGTAAALAGDGAAGRETAVVPGFGEDPAEPDLDASAPAEPEQAAEPQVSEVAGQAPDPDGPQAAPNGARAERDGLRLKRDAPRAEPQVSVATSSAADPDRRGAEPVTPRAAANGQPAAGAATASDRIGSYYDEADRAMSAYLAAMGWTGEPETRRTG